MLYAGVPDAPGCLPDLEEIVEYLDEKGIAAALRVLRDEGGPYRRAFKLEFQEAFRVLSGIMTAKEFQDPFKDVMVLSGEDDIRNAGSWYLNMLDEYMNLRVADYGIEWVWLVNQPKSVVDFVFDRCAKKEKDKHDANTKALNALDEHKGRT